MRCFEFNEEAHEGIVIQPVPEPRVPTRGRVRLLLDHKLKNVIREVPKEAFEEKEDEKGEKYTPVLRLLSATLVHKDSGRRVLLAPEPPEWRDDKALVWVTTRTWKGTIGITASPKEGARVVGGCERPIPFGPPRREEGRLIVDPPEEAKLEVLVEVSDTGFFTIRRTGELGAKPKVFVVHWDGHGLDVRRPGYEEVFSPSKASSR